MSFADILPPALPMMILGGYPFALQTAAPQALTHDRAWQWVENEVLNASPDLQYTGPRADVCALKGVIYPQYYGGVLQMEILAQIANQGKPQLLISGVGLIFGFWVVESIREESSIFLPNGLPRKIEFEIVLRRYGNIRTAIKSLINNPGTATAFTQGGFNFQ